MGVVKDQGREEDHVEGKMRKVTGWALRRAASYFNRALRARGLAGCRLSHGGGTCEHLYRDCGVEAAVRFGCERTVPPSPRPAIGLTVKGREALTRA
ncbi:hypothetical protein O3P69_001132 [Scylla paramamosain]|uniref:Uncharacterized protein n=1 Tax=Scylla paramamosain TaxID=85552 RepID=A0AAW0UNV1_SCYPA